MAKWSNAKPTKLVKRPAVCGELLGEGAGARLADNLGECVICLHSEDAECVPRGSIVIGVGDREANQRVGLSSEPSLHRHEVGGLSVTQLLPVEPYCIPRGCDVLGAHKIMVLEIGRRVHIPMAHYEGRRGRWAPVDLDWRAVVHLAIIKLVAEVQMEVDHPAVLEDPPGEGAGAERSGDRLTSGSTPQQLRRANRQGMQQIGLF
jgi:hypothetical protein